MPEIKITDGTSQVDRISSMLQPGFCNVDDLGFEDLLAMAADYARLLKYFGTDNRPEGDWSVFFESDETVIMAMILTTDLKKFEMDFNHFLYRLRQYPTTQVTDYALQDIPNYALAKKIDYWYSQLLLTGEKSGQMLTQKIAVVIQEKLRRELQTLGNVLSQGNANNSDQFKQNFNQHWFVQEQATAADTTEFPTAMDERAWKTNFYAFYNAIKFLQSSATTLLPQSLNSQTHTPGIGLYIAFLGLFKKAQGKINDFSQRHLLFYYRDILQLTAREAIADSTYLTLSTDSGGREISVKKDTEFIAGLDEYNHDIIYTSDHELKVNDAEVCQLHTLYFQRSSLSSPENELQIRTGKATRQFISGAKINKIPVADKKNIAPLNNLSAYPLFGSPKSVADQRYCQDAQLGFSIASPVLLLKEGERNINITLKMDYSSADVNENLNTFIVKLAKTLQPDDENNEPTTDDKQKNNIYRQDAFFKVFRRIFSIYLTTAKGWYEVEEYLPLNDIVDENCSTGHLHIQIQISAKAPAILAYSPEIHGPGYDTDQPLIRFIVNPGAYLYPYSLLKNLLLTEIEIEVDVKGIKDMLLYNSLGQLSPNTPFNPFGPVPTVGSYFLLGNLEARGKDLTGFDLDIEWGDLPRTLGGFKQYYQGYDMPFDNDIFKVDLALLKGGKWFPREEGENPRVKLFNGAKVAYRDGKGIDRKKRISFQNLVELSEPVDPDDFEKEFSYTATTKTGFFKLTLSSPDYAFGQKEYPLKLASALTFNSRLKNTRLHQLLPNSPYVPLINDISLNYRAVTLINVDQMGSTVGKNTQDRIFHVHPFGIDNLTGATDRNLFLLPQYEESGNLFIGLSATPCSGTLSLLFHLADDSLPDLFKHVESAEFTWYYLSANRWLQLQKDHLITDTTRGFQSSGIIILEIPEGIQKPSTVMADDLFWLRVSADRDLHALCSVYSVYTHGLKVSRRATELTAAHLCNSLPAATIKSSRVSIPGITGINQITDSFGGAAPENHEQLKTRISERLKHKHRASTAWDFERLILQQFPELFKVKCFANRVDAEESEKQICPGHILIVVIPNLQDQSSEKMQRMVNDLLLRDIRDFVENIASPFAKIKVRNPDYAKIQIRCAVKFSRGKSDGYYISELNQAIIDYLSPWKPGGYGARFGWKIRRYDLESFIRKLDYIDFVTKFSMLLLIENREGGFILFDTVSGSGRDDEVRDITPVYPWSIAIPAQRHFIETINQEQLFPPERAGVADLEIGRTLIIAERQNNGEEK